MSDELLCVLPVISHHTADVCVRSLLQPDSAAGLSPSEILVVDNTREGWARDCYQLPTYRDPDGHNLGVARSWNVGARRVLDGGFDYLVVMSTAMQFGPVLHTTWRRQMETFWGEHVIECDGHSWHLIAFHRRVLETVGLFDEHFYPAYEEGIDFGYRMRMCGMEGGWTRVWVNALSQGHAMHVDLVDCPFGPLRAYYESKWGGGKGDELWELPFGDKPIGFFEDVPIPELAERYGLRKWW